MMRYFRSALLQIVGILAMGVALGGLAICGVLLLDQHWWIALGAFALSTVGFMAVEWLVQAEMSM